MGIVPISHLLPRAAHHYADRLAVWDGDTRYSFADIYTRIRRLAGALAARGIGRGDRVGILDVNSHRYLEAYYACAHAGVVLLPLNPRLSPRELVFVLNDAGAKAMIVAAPFFDLIEAARPDLSTVETLFVYGEGAAPSLTLDYERSLADAEPVAKPVTPDAGEISQIYYTSGTTGEPKGVCLTYGNMSTSALDSILSLGLSFEDRWLHAAPMFHLVDAWSIWSFPMMGAPQICVAFEPERYMRVVDRAKPTATGLPPTLISMVANHPKLPDYDLSSVRFIMYGGSPSPLGLLRHAAGAMPTGYVHAYGITETSGITTVLRADEFCVDGPPEMVRVTASAGRPVPSIELVVVDDEGRILPTGETGEIAVSGPRVMKEYWERPDKTAEVLVDGRYRTGDMGFLDEEGRVYIVDRKKDMIITGGENVYPAEVESVLSTYPAILEVAVIGVPDHHWGEAVKAVVVPRDSAEVTEAEILAHCQGRLANFKIPKSIDFRNEPLPKTGPGKIAKRLLREPYWEGRDRKL